MKGDEEKEFTFTGGRGGTAIDLVLGDSEVKQKIEELRVRDRVESDHQPVKMRIKGGRGKRKIMGEKKNG